MGRRLRKLEHALGATLFEQTREGQVLTEPGERLLASVEVMQQGADAIDGVGGDREAVSGLLRISVSEGFGTWLVAGRLADFTLRYPGITIDLVANSGFLNPSKREADLAVLLARPRSGPVIARKLSDYALGLHAAKSYLDLHADPTHDTLGSHRLIGYVPDLIYAPELRYWSELHEGLAPTIRSSSINAQQRLIAGGCGIGILPAFIGDRTDGIVRVIPTVGVTRSLWLVSHRDTHRLARIRLFRAWLSELVEQECVSLAVSVQSA